MPTITPPAPIAVVALNPRTPGNWILFALMVQHALLSWLLGALALALFLAHRPRFEGAGILTVAWRPWFAKRVTKRYSTTIFRTVFWHPGREVPEVLSHELDTPHEQHERVHVRQMEDAAVQGFFLGLALAAAMWAFGWYAEAWQPALVWELTWLLVPVATMTNAATAVLRWGLAKRQRPDGSRRSWWARLFDVAYLDSEHERSARAQSAVMSSGQTWSEREDFVRR